MPIAVGFLAGVPRQGRVGVGYSTIYGIEVPPAEEPWLTIDDARPRDHRDRRRHGQRLRGRSAGELLDDLLGRATEPEGALHPAAASPASCARARSAGLMVDAVAKAAGVPAELARRALMLSGDLSRTAEIALGEGEQGLRAVGFELFRPILPMLASTAASVEEAVAGFERSSVEWKLDGIRIQIHRRGEEVRIYTRNLNDITESLPGIVAAVRRLPVAQAVLDGEAIWMGDDGPAAVPGDRLADRQRGAARGRRDVPVRPAPRRRRGPARLAARGARRAARRDRAGAARSAACSPPTREAAQRVLDEALAAGHEGVVVKDAASLYSAGRRGKAWRKVKPVRTYDLVVLGAEWGHGRRQGRLSNLHLGARDPRTGELRDGRQDASRA